MVFGERGSDTSEDGEKMILERMVCSFSGVSSVNVQWHKLEGASVGGNGVLICHACFIVEDVQGGCGAAHCQPLVDFLIGGNCECYVLTQMAG